MVQEFFEALRFLTIVPLPAAKNPQPAQLARSMAFFPAVGFLIGFVSLWAYALVIPWLPSSPAHLVLIVLPIFLSGGLHLDGLADCCDGIFGGRSRADVLRIMKDSHIGTFGAAAIMLMLLAKYEFVKAVPNKAAVYLLALTAGRWAQVVLSFALPAASETGLASAVARQVGARELGIASVFLFAVTLLAGWTGFAALLWALMILWALGWFFRAKAGGITGDLLGASSEIVELTILVAASMAGKG